MCSSGDFITSIEQEEEVLKWSNGSAEFHCLCTLERRLDGQLADVLHERRTKTKSVSCRCGSGYAERLTRGETALDPDKPEKPRMVKYCTRE